MGSTKLAGSSKYRGQSLENLRAVFPEGDIYAVTDDDRLGPPAMQAGLWHVPIAELAGLPPGANVILFLRRTFPSIELRRALQSAKVLVVPISAFDPALDAALYTQSLVFRTDYRAVCQRNKYWVDNITSQPGPLVFSSEDDDGSGPRTDLTCRLGEQLRADTTLRPQVAAGEWLSVGGYCEFALIPESAQDGAIVVDGVAAAAGMLVAADGGSTTAGADRCRAARRLRVAMLESGPITLRMEGGVLSCVRAGATDFTDAVRMVTNPAYGLRILELGIGTNQEVLPWLDWSVNSQLNEGAGPVHLGFGEGITGAHIDFVIGHGSHRFLAA